MNQNEPTLAMHADPTIFARTPCKMAVNYLRIHGGPHVMLVHCGLHQPARTTCACPWLAYEHSLGHAYGLPMYALMHVGPISAGSCLACPPRPHCRALVASPCHAPDGPLAYAGPWTLFGGLWAIPSRILEISYQNIAVGRKK